MPKGKEGCQRGKERRRKREGGKQVLRRVPPRFGTSITTEIRSSYLYFARGKKGRHRVSGGCHRRDGGRYRKEGYQRRREQAGGAKFASKGFSRIRYLHHHRIL